MLTVTFEEEPGIIGKHREKKKVAEEIAHHILFCVYGKRSSHLKHSFL